MSIPYLLQLSTDNAELQSQLEMFGLLGGGVYAVVFALLAAMLVGMWKMFVKAGQPGWAAIVPFYNDSVLVDICGLPATYKYYLWLGIALMPLAGGCFGVAPVAAIIVRYFMLRVLLASFGRPNEPLNVVGALLFPYVTYPSIGFGSDTYLGVQAAAVAAAVELSPLLSLPSWSCPRCRRCCRGVVPDAVAALVELSPMLPLSISTSFYFTIKNNIFRIIL